MDALGLTRPELATQSGVTSARLSGFEAGISISIKNARRLAPVLKVPMLELLVQDQQITREEIAAMSGESSPVDLSRVSTPELAVELSRRVAND